MQWVYVSSVYNSKVCDRVTMLNFFFYIAELSCNIHKPSWQAFGPPAKQECGQKVPQTIQASVYRYTPPTTPHWAITIWTYHFLKRGLPYHWWSLRHHLLIDYCKINTKPRMQHDQILESMLHIHKILPTTILNALLLTGSVGLWPKDSQPSGKLWGNKKFKVSKLPNGINNPMSF